MGRKITNSNGANVNTFSKRYQFISADHWHLPQAVFEQNHWQIARLQASKQELNAIKEQLSNYDIATWSLHTKKRDPSTQIINTIRKCYNPELLTQAWCKLYECLSRFDLISKAVLEKGQLNSLHICEAPGGFISALNHYLCMKHHNIKLCWHGNSLNPAYEGNATSSMIPDDRLIDFTKESWLFGADHTGDITKYYNYKWITERVLEQHPEKADLVTADGSVDCMGDPGNQESMVEHLHYCEVITALTVLQKGGSFVLKIFTIFEDSTISLLYLLNCVFASVCIIKPITSKSGNSEMYVICQGFTGALTGSAIWDQLLEYYTSPDKDKSLFAISDIPGDFLAQIEECSAHFMQLQISAIRENIRHFGRQSKAYNHKLYKQHTETVGMFLELYPVQHISIERRIVPQHELKLKVCHPSKSSRIFKYYRYSGAGVNADIIYGKRLDKVLYSKFAQLKQLQEYSCTERVNISEKRSLFNTCKAMLGGCNVIDCTDLPKAPSRAHHEALRRFLNLFAGAPAKRVLMINLPLFSNFLVGILYILSEAFTIYFFKNGVICLAHNDDSLKYNRAKQSCLIIHGMIMNTPTGGEFDLDVLQLVDSCAYDDIFINCVQFYNSHLK